jgi:pantoate--beta-alanine ligase
MVKLVHSTPELETLRSQEKKQVGFVPTMGNLHAGHISLLEKALGDNDVVYFSIFVNPKQFGPSEDFKSYPRTLEDDLKLIQECLNKYPGKKIVIFAPKDTQEVFPANDNTQVSVSNFNRILEGEFRPDHFDGVSTVVFRLFNLVKPHKAYFGLKDYQQFLVIRQMTKDLALPIEVIGMPIIREDSGLALSSRNQYLSSEQKELALTLSKSLKKLEALIDGKKENLLTAKNEIKTLLLDPKWNYLEIRDAQTLSPDLAQTSKMTILGVYQLGSTRLLDNLQMELE